MPFVAGIAFSGLTAGSTVFAELLSSEDPSFALSFMTRLGDNLEGTLKEIPSLSPQKPVAIILSLPSYLSRENRKPIFAAFKRAGLVFPHFSENFQRGHNSLVRDDHGPRNELLLHLTPTVVTMRLVTTTVEDGIRESTTLNETTVDSPSADATGIISHCVDIAQATLHQNPSEVGTTGKLERIIVIDTNVTSARITHSSWKHRDEAVPIELTEITLPRIAVHAANSALCSYRSSNEHTPNYNFAIVRVGVVKADGFVLTLIPRRAIFPQTRSATFTTLKDDQTKVTISIVVGESPRAKDNIIVAQLVLNNLPHRPAGVLGVRVTVNVQLDGEMQITAVEGESGVSAAAVVKGFLGDDHHWDEVEELLEKELGSTDEQAEKAEKEWIGKDKQGALLD